MHIFNKDRDLLLRKWPRNEQELKENPTVLFTIDRKLEAKTGDRIYMGMELAKQGPNSGLPMEIYLELTFIQEQVVNPVYTTQENITATVKRIEL